MPLPRGLKCIRCDQAYPLDRIDLACEACAAEDVAANLTVDYGDRDTPPARDAIPDRRGSLWRFEAQLPLSAAAAVSLGEGDTPLIRISGFGHDAVYLKDETRNPTWSFKDRLATVAVSWARHTGAGVIATSSTGNAGAAAAAYAARAGIPCVVVATADAGGPMVAQMRGYGAMVLSVPSKDDRWNVVSAGVGELGWFPTSPFFGPAVGSNPIGVEGYKTLAYEIAEQLGWAAPDWCVLPVCYGDALHGMWKGFDEMRRWGWTDKMPRLVAVEVSGSLTAALQRDESMPPDVPRAAASVAASIDMTRGTYQALHAVRRSNGRALTVADEAIVGARDRVARDVGHLAELSSAAGFAGLEMLVKSGAVSADQTVVVVSTASGLKDLNTDPAAIAAPPSVTPEIDSIRRALHDGYGFDV